MRYCSLHVLFIIVSCLCAGDPVIDGFITPPDSAKPGVYWYFMDGNISRTGMLKDLEAMKAAGLNRVVFLEVNVGVARGPVHFLSEPWQDLFAYAVHEAERLGMEITLGSGPGWAGSGGPWVKPEQSMQHLVGSTVEVQGPGPFQKKLVVAPPRKPYFGLPNELKKSWSNFYRDVAVLAFPTREKSAPLGHLAEKALYVREPYTSKPGVTPRIDLPADVPDLAEDHPIPMEGIIDITDKIRSDGTVDWQIPPGSWTVVRLVSRNNGMSTRPAPAPGIGFECDKFDAVALDAHMDNYVDRLLKKVGPRQPGRGWTMLHIDSWEMGAQNWSRTLRDAFIKNRGYDPQPYYLAYLGYIVGSRERTERFLWDLRQTGSELIISNHGGHFKELGRQHGMTLSIEPYDMHPGNDFEFGALADVPMGEFWSVGFNSTFSCQQASSIGHIMGRPIIAAEAFTGDKREAWTKYPGALKNQGDWAFGVGINRFFYHTFAHKPDDTRPGMVMGPYGVHWDRGQTWWPMVESYHRYVSRCQFLLSQGRTVADVLYVMPEGAPNVFTPPASAFSGDSSMPDRRGYNCDGCSAEAVIRLADVCDGQIVFPGGATYRLLVLPHYPTMTPAFAEKIKMMVARGATIMGAPPLRSPSLSDYPQCDGRVAALTNEVWGSLTPPSQQTERTYGKGRIIWGGEVTAGTELYPSYDVTSAWLNGAGIAADFSSSGPLRYTHRRTAERDLYFVSNRTDQALSTTATFRVQGLKPEWWNPIDGTRRSVSAYTEADGLTTVSLQFAAYGSGFVVFPQAGVEAATIAQSTHPIITTAATMSGPWDVHFDASLGGPDHVRFDQLVDWTSRPEAGIRYYSGIATYRTTFDISAADHMASSRTVLLDLGQVQVMARVRVNGKDCGVAWTAPWRVDITEAVKTSNNMLEIDVANLWPNRMIGDAVDTKNKISESTFRPYKAKDALLPSGLLGPVKIMVSPSFDSIDKTH